MSQKLFDAFLNVSVNGKSLQQGVALFKTGDAVTAFIVIIEGALELSRTMPNGKTLVIQRGGPQSLFAEASLYSTHYHCDAMAIKSSIIRYIPKSKLLSVIMSNPEISVLWSQHLAHEVQTMRTRAEILTLKTVAERFDAWLTMANGKMPEKGSWHHIAADIGVSPEALYRHLASRRIQ